MGGGGTGNLRTFGDALALHDKGKSLVWRALADLGVELRKGQGLLRVERRTTGRYCLEEWSDVDLEKGWRHELPGYRFLAYLFLDRMTPEGWGTFSVFMVPGLLSWLQQELPHLPYVTGQSQYVQHNVPGNRLLPYHRIHGAMTSGGRWHLFVTVGAKGWTVTRPDEAGYGDLWKVIAPQDGFRWEAKKKMPPPPDPQGSLF